MFGLIASAFFSVRFFCYLFCSVALIVFHCFVSEFLHINCSMDCFREGGSTSRPPMLDGANYPYWKARMRAFLKAIDERVWISVTDGWSPL